MLSALLNNMNMHRYGLYSDWCPPQGCGGFSPGTPTQDPSGLNPPVDVTNSRIVSSFYYITQLRIICKYAAVLGHSKDLARYTAVLAPLPAAFNEYFFNASSATYEEVGDVIRCVVLELTRISFCVTRLTRQRLLCENVARGWSISSLVLLNRCIHRHPPQTTISLAWHLGVIPAKHRDAVINTLVNDVASRGYHLDTGIVGIKFLLATLSQAGRGDVALMVAQVRKQLTCWFELFLLMLWCQPLSYLLMLRCQPRNSCWCLVAFGYGYTGRHTAFVYIHGGTRRHHAVGDMVQHTLRPRCHAHTPNATPWCSKLEPHHVWLQFRMVFQTSCGHPARASEQGLGTHNLETAGTCVFAQNGSCLEFQTVSPAVPAALTCPLFVPFRGTMVLYPRHSPDVCVDESGAAI